MPNREDENWISWNENKSVMGKRALCPFCGKGDRLYFHKDSLSWRCGWCEKSFPTPSGGAPKPANKKEFVERYQAAKRFGRIKESKSKPQSLHWDSSAGGYVPYQKDRYTEFKPSHEPSKWSGSPKDRIYKKHVQLPRFSWFFLLFLINIGFVIIIYTTNLIFSHHINTGVGIGIIVVSVLIIISNVFALAKRYRRAKPGRIVANILIFAFIGAVLLAYNGVAPFSTAKDSIVNLFNNGGEGSSATSGFTVPTSTSAPTYEWVGLNGEHEHEYVMSGASYIVGGDGQKIELFNNPQAHDPSWEELKAFLADDDTDEIRYSYPIFVCADFAERLHNNAEEAGLIAAYVQVDLSGYTDPYGYGIPSDSGHALNGFNTIDRGLVYIDCTGLDEYYPCSLDKKVNVVIGAEYIPQNIFYCGGWYFGSMGTVTDIDVQW